VLSKEYVAFPERRRLFILAAFIARAQVRQRIRDHHANGRVAAYETASFISNTLARYLLDLHRGEHRPVEDPSIFS
jgi:hypothetical protein